jgi:hypothetical protein
MPRKASIFHAIAGSGASFLDKLRRLKAGFWSNTSPASFD